MTKSTEIIVLPDRAALAREAARRFVLVAQEAIATRSRLSVALAGGSTPRDLYATLAAPEIASQVDWTRVHLFWGDERAVPPDHPDSNYRMAQDTLLTRIRVPAQNVHRVFSEKSPELAARECEVTLRGYFQPADSVLPRFDLILLGLGEDGHTASLFPHTAALHESSRWVVSQYVEKLKIHRITFTAPLINAAMNIFFIVAGAEKAKVVQQVLRGEYRPHDLPAQLIQPQDGNLVWLLDQDAASKMETGD